MKKNIYSVIVCIFIILVICIVLAAQSLFSSEQDVLVKASPSNAMISIDDLMIGRDTVCIPQVKHGKHTFAATRENAEVSAEFFVSDNIVTRTAASGQTETVPVVVQKDGLELQLQPTSCKTWTF